MVWVKNVGMKPVFVCAVCGSGYKDAETAIKCEVYCQENKSPSPEISKKAIHKHED